MMTNLLRPVSSNIRFFCICTLLLAIPPSFAALPTDLDLQLVTNITGAPVAVRHANDGSGRSFILERSGRIYIHDGSQ